MPKKVIIDSDLCRRFADIRKLKNINKRRFSDTLGINQSVAGDIELGYREPSRDVLLKLATVYDVNINWLLTGEGEMLLSPIPVKTETGYKIPLLNQRVSCGDGANWEDEQNIESYIDVFSLIPRHKLGRLFALSVQGNSMIGAGIKNGDYVLFCIGDDQVLDDDIYVFSLDGEVFCKQLEFDKISRKIKIYSIRVADLEKAELLTTLSVEDTDFTDRFHIFGRVFSWIHPNFMDE